MAITATKHAKTEVTVRRAGARATAADDPLAGSRVRILVDAFGGAQLAKLIGVNASQPTRWAGFGCERPLRPTIEAWRSLEAECFDTKGAVAVLSWVRAERVRDPWEARPHPPRTTRARPGWAIAGAVAVFLIAYGSQAVSAFLLYLSPAASADRAPLTTRLCG